MQSYTGQKNGFGWAANLEQIKRKQHIYSLLAKFASRQRP